MSTKPNSKHRGKPSTVQEDRNRSTVLRSISFDPDTFEEMEALLDKTGLSRSQFIRQLVEDHLRSKAPLPGANEIPGRRRRGSKKA